jgi:hypothetical protein
MPGEAGMADEWDFMDKGAGSLEQALADMSSPDPTLSEWIRGSLERRGLARNVVIRGSRLNQTFAYQIIAGTRRASRDKLLQLAFGMGLRRSEASELLERGGTNPLSSGCRRDVVIAFCLERRLTLIACDDLLWSLGEATICDGGATRRGAVDD